MRKEGTVRENVQNTFGQTRKTRSVGNRSSSDDDFASTVNYKNANFLIKLQVGGTSVEMLIDSGVKSNILNEKIEDIVSAN